MDERRTPVELTRRTNPVEATPQGAPGNDMLRLGDGEARRARRRSERFFVDRHGVRPDPALVVGGDAAGDDHLGRHWVVVCADRRGAARPHR